MRDIENKAVMSANIKYYMKEKDINAKDLSKILNVPYTTVISWTKGEYYPRIDKIEKMSEFFGILKSDLIEDKSQKPTGSELSDQEKGGNKMAEWSRDIFAKNLRYYLSMSGKTQKELAKIIGVSAPTMHEWCAGKKTPRMDKVQKLANYFGILNSDLIEDKSNKPTKSELSDRKKEFLKKVEAMTDEQIDRLEQILALVESKGQ